MFPLSCLMNHSKARVGARRQGLVVVLLTSTLALIGCGGSSFSVADDGSGGSGARPSTGGMDSGGSGAGGSSTGGSAVGGTASGGSAAGGGSGGAPGSTEVWASDFDQSCDYDGECEQVVEGDVCACGGCANAAISRSELEAFELAVSSVMCEGPPQPCPAIACEQTLPACADHKCTIRQPLYIQAGMFDTACYQDSDCHAISLGEVCSECRCDGHAVNKGGYEKYLEIIAEVNCSPGPDACDCAAIEGVYCDKSNGGEMGTCEVGSGPIIDPPEPF